MKTNQGFITLTFVVIISAYLSLYIFEDSNIDVLEKSLTATEKRYQIHYDELTQQQLQLLLNKN